MLFVASAWLLLAVAVQWNLFSKVPAWWYASPPGLRVLLVPVLAVGGMLWAVGLLWGFVFMVLTAHEWLEKL